MQYIRDEKPMDINEYKKSIASYKVNDPIYAKTYTEEEKQQQREAAQKLQTQLTLMLAKGDRYFKVEPGIYRYAGQVPFEFTGVQDLYLDISGCEFILEGTQRLISFMACSNVIVQGPATVERDPFMSTQFTVQEYDEGAQTLTVKLMDGYALHPKVYNGGTFQWFKEDGSMIQTCFISYSSVEMMSEENGIVRFNGVACNRNMTDEKVLKAGQIGAIATTGGMAQLIHMNACKDMQLLDITNYGSGMIGLIWGGLGTDVVQRVYNIRRPGTNRLVAGSAGQWEYNGGSPKFQNCIFGFCEDDSLDIMGHVGFLYEQETPTTVIYKSTSTGTPAVKAGDTLSFFNGDDYTRRGSAKVVAVEEISDTAYNDAARQDMIDHYNFFDSLSRNACVRVTLDQEISVQKGDMVENEDSWRPVNAEIKDCYFHDMGCRVLVQGCKGLLMENNLIERSGLSAICIDCEQRDWGEGPNSTDVVIRNNTIVESNSSPYATHFVFQHSGAISVGPSQVYQGVTPSKATDAYKNITIEGNTILDSQYSGVLVKNAGNVTVRNNTIENAVTKAAGPVSADGEPSAQTPASYYYGEEADYAIYLYACEGITLEGNNIKNSAKYCKGDVRQLHCQ